MRKGNAIMSKKKKSRNKKYNPIKHLSSNLSSITNNHVSDLLCQTNTAMLEDIHINNLINPIKSAIDKLEEHNGGEVEHVAYVETVFICINLIELLLKTTINGDDKEILLLKLEAKDDLEIIHNKIDSIIDNLLQRAIQVQNNNYLTYDEVLLSRDVFLPMYIKYLKYLDAGLVFKTVKNVNYKLNNDCKKTPHLNRYRVTYDMILDGEHRFISTHIPNSHKHSDGIPYPI
jgi:hypothetical protein